MKAGWQVRKFGDVCELKKGKKPVLLNSPANDSKPYLVAKFLRGSAPVEYASISDRNSILVEPHEIIIICDGSNSGETFIGFDGILSSTMAKIVHGENLDNKFLMNYLESLFEIFNAGKTGAAIPHLDLAALKEQVIPMPPLSEQQRIVTILDEAFDGITTAKSNAEKNLQNARALFESHLQSVFTQRGEGWIEKPLSELCNIKHGFAFKSEYFATEGDYVVLTPGNFYESGGYRDRGDKQKYYSGAIPRGFVLSEGDLLVAMTEQAAGLLGSPIIVPESDKFLHNQRLGLVTKKLGIPWVNEFFFHVFNTQTVRQEIHDSASGVKVRHTSPTKIGEVVVCFPASVSEQLDIVSTFKNLRAETQRLESIYRQKLATLDELKKSLLDQAFCGAL